MDDFYKAPAYQEYAANLLSNDRYFNMTLEEAGLFHKIRLMCWCNQSVSSSPDTLARRAGLDPNDVRRVLPSILPMFKESAGLIFDLGLETYRSALAHKAEAKAKAGKASGKARKQSNTCSTDDQHMLNTLNINQTKPSQTHAVKGRSVTTVPMPSTEHEEWLKEYGNV